MRHTTKETTITYSRCEEKRARWSVGTKEYGVYTTENAQTETNEGAVSAGRTKDIQYKSRGVRIWHKVTCSTMSRVDHVIKSPWVELETSTNKTEMIQNKV